MTEKIKQPVALNVLTDLEALKTIADPLRNQIMEVLTTEPLTVGQIAGLSGGGKEQALLPHQPAGEIRFHSGSRDYPAW